MRFCLNYLQNLVSYPTKGLAMNHSDLQAPTRDQDFVLWLEHQINVLEAHQLSQLDLPNLLDELEHLVSSYKRKLAGSLRVLITHLLKCEYQPWRRSPSWIRSILTHRDKIERLIEDSPCLAAQLVGQAEREYRRALRHAILETGLPEQAFPSSLPFSQEQLRDPDFIPPLPRD